jgi:glycine/D-amino acid oxidase-like deaminating enzyme
MAMAEESLDGWRRWNAEWDEPLFHETGVTMLTHAPMQSGGFEYESYHMALSRGHHPDRLDADEIVRRFPQWKPGVYVDGYYNREGGYAESGRVVAKLVELDQAAGVSFHVGYTVDTILEANGRVIGVQARDGSQFHADQVIVCAGTWTHVLLPELAPVMKSSGHPVFHLKPANPEAFQPPEFVVFFADTSATGWYGFPLHPHNGVVKIANHGIGQILHPENDVRVVTAEDEANLRAMLADTFPALLDAPIVYNRRCLYCDTRDEHFWIDRHPQRSGLTVAAGGSGHAFKFAPILGGLIADAMEAKPNDWLPKFRWRTLEEMTAGQEAARHHG